MAVGERARAGLDAVDVLHAQGEQHPLDGRVAGLLRLDRIGEELDASREMIDEVGQSAT